MDEKSISMQEILTQKAQQIIRSNPLFSNLSEEQMDELLGMMYEEKVSVGVNIVQEGEPGDTIYIIRSGRAEVLKEDDHGDYHHIAMLKPGDVIGEISLIDNRPRSATVRAVENTHLVGLRVEDLQKKSKPEVSLENILKVNFAKTMSHNIRKLNVRTVNKLKDQLKSTQKQIQMGHYVFRLMTLITLYVLALSVFYSTVPISPGTAYLTIPVIGLFAMGFYQLIQKSGFNLKTFGLTWDGAAYSIRDAVLISVIFMMPLMIVYKLLVISFDPSVQGAPVFFYRGFLTEISMKERVLLIITFALYVPIIEFIARGVAQTSFLMFLNHKNRRWQAILLAALFFSLSNVHISAKFALATFVLGLFWGWLYSRHSSLIGVIISHWLLGYFGLFVLGFNF